MSALQNARRITRVLAILSMSSESYYLGCAESYYLGCAESYYLGCAACSSRLQDVRAVAEHVAPTTAKTHLRRSSAHDQIVTDYEGVIPMIITKMKTWVHTLRTVVQKLNSLRFNDVLNRMLELGYGEQSALLSSSRCDELSLLSGQRLNKFRWLSSSFPSFRYRWKSAEQPAAGQHFREPLH
jgi:hypothetical protein